MSLKWWKKQPVSPKRTDTTAKFLLKAALSVPTGTQEYQFFVSDVWTMDPKCADRALNVYGENGVKSKENSMAIE